MNDLLQSGKSATMLPSMTASSSGHWNHDGSRKWQRAIVPSPSMRTHASTSPRKPSVMREAFPCRAGPGVDIGTDGARRQTGDDLIDQRHALLDLADAHPYARIHIAFLEHRHVERELIVGRIGERAPDVEGAAGGAADIAAGAELLRQRGLKDPGGDGAVLQRSGVVVDFDQLRKSLPHIVEQPAQAFDATFREIGRDAARHHPVHHQPVAEASLRRAQGALAQDAALRVNDRERGVVADRADVAEMVGEPLELRHQRAQIVRPPRHVDVERGFDGAGEGQRIGDRAVAGGAAREPRAPSRAKRLSSASSMPLCT